MQKIYVLIIISGGVAQDIRSFTDLNKANEAFIKTVNVTYKTEFKETELVRAQDHNAENGCSDLDVLFMESQLE